MPAPAKVLAFAGSLRKGSLNKKLVKIAAAGATAAGAAVTLIDLAEFPMPLYDGDNEAAGGLPEHARRLKQLFIDHDALLISSPEYNSSISAALKNALDWISRPSMPGEKGLIAFEGKVAGLLSATPSWMGGLRGLAHLRSILGNIKVQVLPEQVTISTAHDAFNADGTLKEAKHTAAAEAIGRRVAEVAGKLRG